MKILSPRMGKVTHKRRPLSLFPKCAALGFVQTTPHSYILNTRSTFLFPPCPCHFLVRFSGVMQHLLHRGFGCQDNNLWGLWLSDLFCSLSRTISMLGNIGWGQMRVNRRLKLAKNKTRDERTGFETLSRTLMDSSWNQLRAWCSYFYFCYPLHIACSPFLLILFDLIKKPHPTPPNLFQPPPAHSEMKGRHTSKRLHFN